MNRSVDERLTSSTGGSILGSLANLAPRAEITDNVYQSPGVEIGRDIDYDRQPESGYLGEMRGEVEAQAPAYVREVNIKPLSSGYLVNVGCQSVAVETTATLLKTLGEYLNNPTEFEIAWNKNSNRNKL